MTHTPLRVLESPEAIGDDMARRLLERIDRARTEGRRFLLGCPTGRTPRPIYAAIGRRLAREPRDLEHVVLVMMDEYLVRAGDALSYPPAEAPWSCHSFAEVEIVPALLPGAVWFPDPSDAEGYDARIAEAGGIDFFLLASGASDGHVAFNPPGSARTSRTRIVELSEETRRDNLQTFPSFGSLDAVPKHGVCVGIETIASAKEAAMVVWGAGKRLTLRRMLAADRYDPSWPATVIHECAAGEIVAAQDTVGQETVGQESVTES